ncbi:hypothetical protein [Psychroserpens sp. Hel_I_66]|uniref:hypothetical protein n=1 Tax=Psychroserpens sp. Hel_I_66 TaxID=1250004 RepID=UPI0012E0A2FE|nr:hypothetical protein [Psychroserpens sp. Hel_I_66]
MDIGEKSASDSLWNSSIRLKNAISISGGSTLMNNDIGAPDFENFIELKFKRFIAPSIAISGNIKKFDIKNYDFKDNGFLSGDLNLEWILLPRNNFSPIFYAGPGLLISNDFEDKNYKVQGGLGFDFMVNSCVSIVGALGVNYVYNEQKGSQLLQSMNSLYYNATIGVQFYFGKRFLSKSRSRNKKLNKNDATIIQSNTINNK